MQKAVFFVVLKFPTNPINKKIRWIIRQAKNPLKWPKIRTVRIKFVELLSGSSGQDQFTEFDVFEKLASFYFIFLIVK